ncbi:MAG: fumarylacetoacetate hydrolase family protein [Solirubrobacterales bacterium]
MRLLTYSEAGGPARVGRLEGEEVVELAAGDMLDWLRGDGGEETGRRSPLAEVRLHAPVPEPPSLRDFYAFEGHVETGWRRRGGEIPEAWYEAPAFYFSNPASIHGPGEEVKGPAGTSMLDFELEIAAVIGAGERIAGFTLLNDWSARDIQRREMTVGLGPAKGKDFASSLGPWLVTVDELPLSDGRLRIEAGVSVNGRELTRTDASAQHFSWEEIREHAASQTRLRPGDVLGSGTLDRGCLLELGPLKVEGRERWLEPGDVVELWAEGLGSLRTPIV